MPDLLGTASQGVQLHRRDVQRIGLLPHRQPLLRRLLERIRRLRLLLLLLELVGLQAEHSRPRQEGIRPGQGRELMLKGFKEFLLRGNVIDLAVAVVIGAAFTAIVNSIVNDVFNPLIGAVFNAESLSNAFPVVLRDAPPGEEDTVIRFGAVLAALIQFLLVATVVYFALVVPMNYLKRVA